MGPDRRKSYEEPGARTRVDLTRALRSSDPREVCAALVSAAFRDPDWRWVQSECVRLAEAEDSEVRGVVATCIGHLARIHGVVDSDVVEAVLSRLARDPDPAVAGRVADAREDIAMFAKTGGKKERGAG